MLTILNILTCILLAAFPVAVVLGILLHRRHRRYDRAYEVSGAHHALWGYQKSFDPRRLSKDPVFSNSTSAVALAGYSSATTPLPVKPPTDDSTPQPLPQRPAKKYDTTFVLQNLPGA